MFLYCTADKVGGWSGGSQVTQNESTALATLGTCHVWDREFLLNRQNSWEWLNQNDPWGWDIMASEAISPPDLQMAHFYAGTFTKTIEKLQAAGIKVTYTCAAHSVETSRREYEKLGMAFPYPHLTNPLLWEKYVAGYKAANLVICPSTYSQKVLQGYGCKRVKVIPHGCNIPKELAPLPRKFVVGYLGAYGPDKGVAYLLQAWKKLNYKDNLLLLGGKDSNAPWVENFVRTYGGGNIGTLGWVEDIADFYNRISLYIQPSVTEGWGCEVLEAMAHGRPVLCSTGAGAADVVPNSSRFQAGNVEQLIQKIEEKKKENPDPDFWLSQATPYAWPEIRQQYMDTWKDLM